MAQLPQFQSDDRNLQLMQNAWATQLNPLLANPITQGNILKSVPLTTGNNVINHKLGRKLQGYIIVDINAAASLYRSAPKSDITLTLNSSANAVADILVF